MNENYVHPDMPEGVEVVRGLYRLSTANVSKDPSSTAWRGGHPQEVEAAAELLARDFGIAADVWSVTSVNELSRR